MFNLKKLFKKQPSAPTWAGENFVYIRIPENVQPLARGEKYEDPLQAALSAHSLGEIDGGGTSFNEKTGVVEFAGIDVNTPNVEAALPVLRRTLVGLGAPPGTTLEYRAGSTPLEDRLDGAEWLTGQTRTNRHPGFGV